MDKPSGMSVEASCPIRQQWPDVFSGQARDTNKSPRTFLRSCLLSLSHFAQELTHAVPLDLAWTRQQDRCWERHYFFFSPLNLFLSFTSSFALIYARSILPCSFLSLSQDDNSSPLVKAIKVTLNELFSTYGTLSEHVTTLLRGWKGQPCVGMKKKKSKIWKRK